MRLILAALNCEKDPVQMVTSVVGGEVGKGGHLRTRMGFKYIVTIDAGLTVAARKLALEGRSPPTGTPGAFPYDRLLKPF